MKALVIAFVLLLVPVYASAKDAGPAKPVPAKRAEVKKVPAKAVKKAEIKKVPAKAVKKAEVKPKPKTWPPKKTAAKMTESKPKKKDAGLDALIKKSEVKVEGKVEVPDDTKVTLPPKPTTAEEAVGLVNSIVIAFKSGKVWYGISLILMLATFVLGLVKRNIPTKALPWIAASLGVLTNVVGSIVSGTVLWEAVISGFFQGATAAGLWSLVFKHVFMTRADKDKRIKARNIVEGKVETEE